MVKNLYIPLAFAALGLSIAVPCFAQQTLRAFASFQCESNGEDTLKVILGDAGTPEAAFTLAGEDLLASQAKAGKFQLNSLHLWRCIDRDGCSATTGQVSFEIPVKAKRDTTVRGMLTLASGSTIRFQGPVGSVGLCNAQGKD